MGRTPSRTNKKTSESRGENGKKPQSLTEGINEKVNAAEEKVQEIEERGKPKRRTVAEVTKLLEEAEKRAKQAEEQVQQQQVRIKNLEEYSAQRNKDLAEAEELNKILQGEGNQKAEAIRILNDNLKASSDKNEKLSKVNQDVRQQNSYLTEAIRQGALKSDKEVTDAVNAIEPKAEKVKTDNSGTTEETVAPETGEAKVKGEPEVKTEQAQATQEPKSEAKQTSTESSEMTPEEVYDYLSNKDNFAEANTYFSSGKDGYVTKDNKRIPKSWFETFKENKDKDHSIQHKFFNQNNKDVFTASLRNKGLLEDPKKEPSREEVEKTIAEADAKAKFDKWIESKGNKFRGIIGKHPWITGGLGLSVGVSAIIKAIDAFTDYGREQAVEDMQVPDEEFWGNSEDNEDFNGTDSDKVTEDLTNAAQETGQADNNAEEQAAQALQENLPQGEADTTNQSKGESPVATNASTPASTKASTAESVPTQGLPPVVTRNTPSTNPDSSGMTYSQRVEAGQAPQAGSITYNANNPDMVTAGLIDAMNQAPQAGSDAIGYGDLYDQNFIDFWAKRNPNLAYAVSQGRKS